MAGSRQTAESPVIQGADESIAYSITTTPWGSTPTSVTMVVWDITDADVPVDVTSTVVTGSISTSGDVITTKRIRLLTLGHKYRVEVLFTDSNSNIWEPFFVIDCADK
jgi:hypothetical protein